MFGLFLITVTVLAYQPVWHAGFIWDDDRYVTDNATLHSLAGLWQIWFQPGVTSQYYPLTFTIFWLEYHLWGLNPLGFHLVNVLLHSLNAILLWRILRRLRVPGAWLAGAIFALHPVNVMSVAWVTELKNTLSTALALGAGHAYLRFSGLGTEDGYNARRRWLYYVLALILFLLAMCAKTAVSFLPVTLLLVIWWQRSRINWRDVLTVVPMIGIVAVMGLVTVSMEHHSEAASSDKFNLNLAERILISGRSFWFYLGKLFFPHQLTFIYERWKIDAGSVWQYVYPVAVLVILGVLWKARRRIGKGIWVAAMHFYICTSMLILIMTLFMMRYSFVSDHWQYFGCMSVIAVVAAGIMKLLDSGAKIWSMAIITGFLLVLGTLTWRQCGIYANSETLWRATIAENSDCGLAHNNLGLMLLDKGQTDEALLHLQRAEEINPDNATAQNNLGSALLQHGDSKEALVRYKRALAIQSDYAPAYNNLGDFFIKQGQADEAIPYLLKALAIEPNLTDASYNLGNAFVQKGELDAAIQQWQKVLKIQPEHAKALNNLGNALLGEGQIQPAIGYLRRAVDAQPDFADANNNLGTALIQGGQTEEAVHVLEKTLKIHPDFVPAQNNLAWVLATCSRPNIRNGGESVKLAQRAEKLSGGNNPLILRTLAAAYAENGQFANAVAVAQQALRLLPPDSALAGNIQDQIQHYETGLPIRE
jgi:tetratricopeptide (TPR) repeat protein